MQNTRCCCHFICYECAKIIKEMLKIVKSYFVFYIRSYLAALNMRASGLVISLEADERTETKNPCPLVNMRSENEQTNRTISYTPTCRPAFGIWAIRHHIVYQYKYLCSKYDPGNQNYQCLGGL